MLLSQLNQFLRVHTHTDIHIYTCIYTHLVLVIWEHSDPSSGRENLYLLMGLNYKSYKCSFFLTSGPPNSSFLAFSLVMLTKEIAIGLSSLGEKSKHFLKVKPDHWNDDN